MLLHRGIWNDDRYVVMKADAMSRDPRRQRYDWHKRDIMPKCVVSLVRHWFPNPRGFPYICGNKTQSWNNCLFSENYFCTFSLGISFGGKYCFSSINSVNLYCIFDSRKCCGPVNYLVSWITCPIGIFA